MVGSGLKVILVPRLRFLPVAVSGPFGTPRS
jgi:hypothetical protein